MLLRLLLNKLQKVIQPANYTKARDCQLNVNNFSTLRAEQPIRFDFLRFDPNNSCNSHCVYCHNHRSDSSISTKDFQGFVDNNVLWVNTFQMGCIMEPTMDGRMGDLLLLVATSRACPRKKFILQTNGILLHKHDHGKIREAGVTRLSISIDSNDPAIHSSLRGGASIRKLTENITNFTRNCPNTEVVFITTVTQLNIASMESLVRFGMDLGVGQFTFRKVFYHRDNDVVDHTRMPALILQPGDFKEMKKEIYATFRNQVSLHFADEEFLQDGVKKILADSQL